MDSDNDGAVDTQVGSTTTEANGHYYFGGVNGHGMTGGHTVLPETKYQIRIDLSDPHLNGMSSTLKDVNDPVDDRRDSDGDAGALVASHSTIEFTTGRHGENDHTLDFGFLDACVGDLVWDDTNHNGIQDAGESGVSGVGVQLLDTDGNAVAGESATTNADGYYHICGIAPGNYIIKFNKDDFPAGYILSPKDQGGNDNKDSDADNNGQTVETTLDAGENDTSWDAGIYKAIDLSLIKEANATEVNAGDNVRFTITVHNDGPAEATGVVAKDVVPNGYSNISNPSSGASVSGSTVTISVGTLANGASKSFTFEATVEESGDHTNWAEITAANEYDVDSDPGTDHTADDLGDGLADDDEDSATVTAVANGTWSGNVGKDTDDDNAKDENIEGVEIKLYQDTNHDGAPDGDAVATTTTDGSGNYRFTGLTSGDYVAVETQPANMTNVSENEGGADNDDKGSAADNNQISGTVDVGENDSGNDFVEEDTKGAWSGNVGKDTDDDNLKDENINNVEIKLYTDPDGNGNPSDGALVGTTHTDANGDYRFADLTPGDYVAVETQPANMDDVSENEGGDDNDKPDNGITNAIAGTVSPAETDIHNDFVEEDMASIGDRVWNDMNHDGIQDVGEEGIAGVIVHLYKDGVDTGVTATTDLEGTYLFDALLPGMYYVKFDLPDGYTFSPKNQGEENTTDSDVDLTKHTTEDTNLTVSENDSTWDAGMYSLASQVKIGNLIWIEDDNDGNPATGTITYPPEGTVVIATSSSGKIYTGHTDTHGHYEIVVPVNDTYMVTVQVKGFVVPTAGSDDSAVHDTVTEDNHTHNGDGTTVTVAIQDNMTVDFGYTTPEYAHIGDYFWIDENSNGIQDTNEPVVAGARVELFDAEGQPINDIHGNHVQITDANGKYGFDVDPGKTYKVRFTIPEDMLDNGYVFTNSGSGDDATDNDVQADGFTLTISPDAGDNLLTLDAGITCGCSGIKSDSIDAMNLLSMLISLLGMILILPVGRHNMSKKFY